MYYMVKILTEREKEVVFLSIDGLTVREIGVKLNISHVMVIKIKNNIKRKCISFKKELIN